MELKIKEIENGYLVEWQEEIEDDKFRTYQEAIINEESEKAEMKDLLYWVAEHFGLSYNKWNKNNLNILWDKKGAKVD